MTNKFTSSNAEKTKWIHLTTDVGHLLTDVIFSHLEGGTSNCGPEGTREPTAGRAGQKLFLHLSWAAGADLVPSPALPGTDLYRTAVKDVVVFLTYPQKRHRAKEPRKVQMSIAIAPQVARSKTLLPINHTRPRD